MPNFSPAQRPRSPISLLSFALTLCFLTLAPLAPLSPVHASTDPLTATVSATARVPSTTPTTGDTTAPPAVILVSPADNSVTGSNRPELIWKQTSDPNGNTVYYTVYLNGVATYLGVSNTGNSQMSNYIARLSDNQVILTPTTDLSDGPYTWTVAAYDLSSNISYSTTWHFTVDTLAPPLRLTDLDHTYTDPTLFEGANFDLPGPQTVDFTFLTEPWATVSLRYTLPDSTPITVSASTETSGIATFSLALPLGETSVVATALDQVGHVTALPLFTVTLRPTPYAGLLSTLRLTPPTSLSQSLPSLRSLPATVSQITAPAYLTIALYSMLALGILLLIILLWHRRPNLLILHSDTQTPYRSLIVYHSRPTASARFALTPSRVFVTHRAPVLYSLPRGKVYIPRLGRYSSLTIRTPNGTTLILSLSCSQKKYIITV